MDYEYATFYENALALFRKAGFTANLTPLSANHSFKQAVYLDSEKTIFVDKGILNCAVNISHLFDLDDAFFVEGTGSVISFYSVQLNCLSKHRSQMAHDVHSILHASFSTDISVILFYHDSNVMISVAGVDEDVILSEWYDFFYDFDDLTDLLNIGQLSIVSSHQFIIDLICVVARSYYLEPAPSGLSAYSVIPLFYYGKGLVENEHSRKKMPVEDFIVQSIREIELKHGDDYVEHKQGIARDMSTIENELDRLSFDLELHEEESRGPDFLNKVLDEKERDEYEYDDIDPEIFEDPTLMLQWLDSQSVEVSANDLTATLYVQQPIENVDSSYESSDAESHASAENLRIEEPLPPVASSVDRKFQQREYEIIENSLESNSLPPDVEEDQYVYTHIAGDEALPLGPVHVEGQSPVSREIDDESELRRCKYELEYSITQQARKNYYDTEVRKAQLWYEEETQRINHQYQDTAKSKKEKAALLRKNIKEKKHELSKLFVIQFLRRKALEREIGQSRDALHNLIQELSEIEQKHNTILADLENQLRKKIKSIRENAAALYPLPEKQNSYV